MRGFHFCPAPSLHVQPFFCSHIIFCATSLVTIGPMVSSPWCCQRLRQCGVQRRFRPSAGVCRGRAHGGANRFEPAAISFAGVVVHRAGVARVGRNALAAGSGLAHAGGLGLVQLQPLCTPWFGVGCTARTGALGRCGVDIGLAGFGHEFGTGWWKSKSTNLS